MSAVGNVFIDVLPSTKNFWKKVKGELGPGASSIGKEIGKEIGDPISEQVSESVTEPLRKALPKAKKSGAAFGGAFANAAEKRIKAALSNLPDAEIGVSTSKADQDLKDLRARLAALGSKSIGVDIDTATALAEVNEIETELQRLNRESPDIQVQVDTGAALAELAAVKKMAGEVDDSTSKMNLGIQGSSSAFSGLTGAALLLGPALVPVLATVAALGVALAAPLAAAGGGFGLYAIFTGVAISRLKETQKEIKKLRTDAAKTADPKKAAKLKQAADDLEADLSRGERGYLKAEALLGSTFDSFIDKNTNAIFGPVNAGLELLASVLPKLSPVIKAVSGSLTRMLVGISDAVNSPGFDKFISAFSGAAANAMDRFAAIAKNVGTGLFNIFKNFGPLSESLMSGLVGLTAQFAKWSASADAKSGIASFIGYVREIGPTVLSVMGSLVAAVVRIGMALAPIGALVLKSVGALANTIRTMPLGLIRGIAIALMAIVVAVRLWSVAARIHNVILRIQNKEGLISVVWQKASALWAGKATIATKLHTAATKVQTIAMRAFNAVMRMNPLGLLITAITLVVGALVILFKKNQAFRTLVLAVWAHIKSAISVAWGAIKSVFTAIKNWLTTVLPPVFAALRRVVSVVFTAIRTYIKVWWAVVRGVFNALRAVLANVIFPIFKRLWNGIIAPVFKSIRSGASNLFSNLNTAFNRIKNAVGKLGSAFNAAKNSISTAWNKIKSVVKKPIKWVVDSVFNKFIGGVNKLIPGSGPLSSISTKGWATGGWTGPGSMHKPAGIVHADEYVIKKSSRRRIEKNHPGILDAMNTYGEVPQGYAKGGRVVPGKGNRHSGYPWATWAGDFPNPTGTPVRAWKSGVVALVKSMAGSYGKHIRMNHTDGTSSLYAHLSRFFVKRGQRVSQGTKIGAVGSTGNSTGPHLHLETMGSPYKGGPAAEPKVGAWKWLSDKFNFKKKLSGYMSGMGSHTGIFGSGFKDLTKKAASDIWNGLKDKIGSLTGTIKGVGKSIYKKINPFFDQGGLASGTGFMAKNTLQPERVLSPTQTDSFEKLANANFFQSANKDKSKPVAFELTVTNWETGRGLVRATANGAVIDREHLNNVQDRMGH